MKPFAESPPGHQPAGKLVDNNDLPVLHDVVHVALEEVVGLQCLIYMVEEVDVFRIVEIVYVDDPFYLRNAVFSKVGRPCLLVYHKIFVSLELVDEPVYLVIFIRRFLGRTGDDKRGSGLIDEDAVNLIDDGVVEFALNAFLKGIAHIISQVIKPELIIRAVCNIASIGLFPCVIVQVMNYDAHGEAKKFIDGPHPLGIPLSEVIVDGYDVDAEPCQRVEVYRKGCHKRLAFACGHLGDLPFVENDAADKLDVKMAHIDSPPRCFADDGECLRQNGIEIFSLREPFLKVRRFRTQFIVGEALHLSFEAADRFDDRLDPLQLPLVLCADYLF